MSEKGNYYKYKTKQWLTKQGYYADYLEKIQRVYSKGQLIYVKRDLFGADILAFNKDEIIFVQVKSGEKTTGINIKKAINEFLKYPFPDFVKLWIVVWRPKEEPKIIDVRDLIEPKIGGTDNE
jgi:hypothetical protein